MPFRFYNKPLKFSKKIPHPLVPRNMRDITLNTMMFPDNIMRSIVADKVSARGWVAEKIGSKHLTTLLDVVDSGAELQLDKYPRPFVIKSTHASGHYKLVQTEADLEGLPELADSWLLRQGIGELEWCYRDIKPRLLVEEMLTDDKINGVYDIKIFCLFGKVVLFYVIQGRFGKEEKTFFTPEWVQQKIEIDAFYDVFPKPPKKPENLAEIIKLAEILSGEFSHIRVDFLLRGNEIYFGEMTNFTFSGSRLFQPDNVEKFLFDEYNRLRKEKIADMRDAYSRGQFNS